MATLILCHIIKSTLSELSYGCNHSQKFLYMISCGKCWKKTQPGVSLEFQRRGTPGFGTTGISSGMDIIIFAASISSPNSPYNWQEGNLATDGCVFLWVWWKMIILLLRWLTSKLQILSKWPSLSPLLPRSLAKRIIYLDLEMWIAQKWGRTTKQQHLDLRPQCIAWKKIPNVSGFLLLMEEIPNTHLLDV